MDWGNRKLTHLFTTHSAGLCQREIRDPSLSCLFLADICYVFFISSIRSPTLLVIVFTSLNKRPLLEAHTSRATRRRSRTTHFRQTDVCCRVCVFLFLSLHIAPHVFTQHRYYPLAHTFTQTDSHPSPTPSHRPIATLPHTFT